MGLGAVVVSLAVLVVIAWLMFMVSQSRVRRRKREAAALNLSPFMTDDELETSRLNGVLLSALIATGILAIIMPIYYLNEAPRQAAAAERFEEIAVERGHHWFEEFQCSNCHGPEGGGGGAPYVEKRSGLSTTWVAPAINDILFRYTDDEVRYWLIWGRQNSPMPAWGAEGGGPLNVQQIEELIAYIDHIQVSQTDVVAAVDSAVDRELARLDGADATLDAAIEAQREEIAAIEAAPAQYEATRHLPIALAAAFTDPGFCTLQSAAVFDNPCDEPAPDRDRDGLSDAAEIFLTGLLDEILAAAPRSDAYTALERIANSPVADDAGAFDPDNAYSTSVGSTRIADFDQAELMVTEFDAVARDLNLAVVGQERLLERARVGLDYLLAAREARAYSIDIPQIAEDGFEGRLADARRASGLYNAYCARCHTAGYSAGVPFTQEAGSGAFGPSLRGDRSVTQFPDIEDQLDFIIDGSQNGQAYGINGVGRGWMPAFGAVLSEADLRLIVQFERALP